MKELELAQKVLVDILKDDVTFKKALKKAFQNSKNDREFSSCVSSLVGCELRHHRLFSKLCETANLEVEDASYVYLALANHFFLKRIDEATVLKYIQEKLGEKFSDELYSLLKFEGSASDALNVDRASLEYVSIRFNVPSWLIKMWNKHYGKGTTFKVLKTLSHPLPTFVRANTLIDSQIKFDEPAFIGTGIIDTYQYHGKENIKKMDEFKNGEFFLFNPFIKDVLDRYVNSLLGEYTLYSGEDDSLVKEFYVRSNKTKSINLIVPDMSKRAEVMRLIRLGHIRNINFFQANDEIAYRTGISSKQDLIVVNPASSSFERIRQYPDYLLHFKAENLDSIIAKQNEVLNDLANFVNVGGTFIYLVDTLNKKETVQVIDSFIKSHPNFEVVEQHQILPFEKEGSTIFYAVMTLKQ